MVYKTYDGFESDYSSYLRKTLSKHKTGFRIILGNISKKGRYKIYFLQRPSNHYKTNTAFLFLN